MVYNETALSLQHTMVTIGSFKVDNDMVLEKAMFRFIGASSSACKVFVKINGIALKRYGDGGSNIWQDSANEMEEEVSANSWIEIMAKNDSGLDLYIQTMLSFK